MKNYVRKVFDSLSFCFHLLRYIVLVLISKGGDFKQIRSSLLISDLFDFPEKDKDKFFLGLSVTRRAIVDIVFGKVNSSVTISKGGIAMIVSREDEFGEKSIFIERNTNERIDLIISKNNAHVPEGFELKCLFVVVLLLIQFLTFPFFFFSSIDKRNLALLPILLLKFVSIATFFNQKKCRKVYLYEIWNSDTNLIERWLYKRGVEVVFIPIENPLALFSTQLLGRKFVSLIPYHNEELNALYNINIEKKLQWKIHAENKIGMNNFKSDKTRNKIAIYSHGSFVRLKLGHPVPSIGDVPSELAFFRAIKTIMETDELKFVIHLHPKEKASSSIIEWSVDNFRTLLGNQIEFADMALSTYELIPQFELAIGSISTVLFERQALGFKTIIFAEGVKGFPIAGSRFGELVASNSLELESKISYLMSLSEKDYREKFSEYIYQ